MASKEFGISVKAVLDAVGFSTGSQKVTKEAKALENGVVQSNKALSNSFSTLTNEALPAFGQQFGSVGTVFGGVKSAIMTLIPTFKAVDTALISTGIGAIIVGISLAIAGLISWMKRTDEGSDGMRKAFDIIKSVIEVVLTKLVALGSAIVKLFKGDFKGATEDAKSAFTGWGSAIKENIETAKKLNEVQDKLEDYNETYTLKRARIEERISELQNEARDQENGTAQERLEANNKLKKAKEELYQLDFGKKQLELAQLKKEIEMGAQNQDQRQKLNEKQAEIVQLQTEHNNAKRETIKLDNQLIEKAKEEAELEANFSNKSNNKINKVDTSNLKIPSLAPVIKNDIKEMRIMKELTSEDWWSQYAKKGVSAFTLLRKQSKLSFIEMSKEGLNFGSIITNQLIGTIQSFGTTLGSTLAGNTNDWRGLISTMIQATNQIIQMFLAQSIAAVIASESKKGLLGLITASVGIAAVSALFASKIQQFEKGGISSGGWALVGEKGPELMNLSAGTRVYNNSETRNMFQRNNVPDRVLIEFKNGSLEGYMNYNQRKRNSYA